MEEAFEHREFSLMLAGTLVALLPLPRWLFIS